MTNPQPTPPWTENFEEDPWKAELGLSTISNPSQPSAWSATYNNRTKEYKQEEKSDYPGSK